MAQNRVTAANDQLSELPILNCVDMSMGNGQQVIDLRDM